MGDGQSINWQGKKFSELTAKQQQAIKDIKERGVNNNQYDVNDFSGVNIFDANSLEKLHKNKENNTALKAIDETMGLDNMFALLDTNGDNVLSTEEQAVFKNLDKEYNDFAGGDSVDLATLYKLALDIVVPQDDSASTDVAGKKETKTDSNTGTDKTDGKTSTDTTDKTDDKTKTNTDNKTSTDNKTNTEKTDKNKSKEVDVKGLTKDYPSKNDEITVTKWGQKPSDGGDQNDCLLRIIQNNYGKDIKYGTDEYWAIANEVMKANPQIYDKGRKIVGGKDKDSTVIYTGEKMYLPDLKKSEEAKTEVENDPKSKTDPEAKTDPETKVNTVIENGRPVGTTEETTVDGVTTVVNKDINGKKTGSHTVATDSSTGVETSVYYDASDVKTNLYKKDKNGRSVYSEEYDKSGNVVKSTQIIWNENDKSSSASRKVITLENGEYSVKTYDSSTKKWTEPVKCDKDGNVTGGSEKKTVGSSDADSYIKNSIKAQTYTEATKTDGTKTRTYYDANGNQIATSTVKVQTGNSSATTTEVVTSADGKTTTEIVTKGGTSGSSTTIKETITNADGTKTVNHKDKSGNITKVETLDKNGNVTTTTGSGNIKVEAGSEKVINYDNAKTTDDFRTLFENWYGAIPDEMQYASVYQDFASEYDKIAKNLSSKVTDKNHLSPDQAVAKYKELFDKINTTEAKAAAIEKTVSSDPDFANWCKQYGMDYKMNYLYGADEATLTKEMENQYVMCKALSTSKGAFSDVYALMDDVSNISENKKTTDKKKYEKLQKQLSEFKKQMESGDGLYGNVQIHAAEYAQELNQLYDDLEPFLTDEAKAKLKDITKGSDAAMQEMIDFSWD